MTSLYQTFTKSYSTSGARESSAETILVFSVFKKDKIVNDP